MSKLANYFTLEKLVIKASSLKIYPYKFDNYCIFPGKCESKEEREALIEKIKKLFVDEGIPLPERDAEAAETANAPGATCNCM